MFQNCIGLNSIDITKWNVSNVTTMSKMLSMCMELETVGDLSNWDTSNVTDMNGMFAKCNKLETIKMLGHVPSNTYKVTNIFSGITTTGTFYYNNAYDYSKIIAVLPSTWTAQGVTVE